MTIDVIICTYNRPQKVMELVDKLIPLSNDFNKLIVVDSSDSDIQDLKVKDKIVYLKSNHKNQPYQRYLGYLNSNADYLLYLDDDMELAKNTIFRKLKQVITSTTNLSGIAIRFEDKHTNTTLNDIPRSTLFKREGIFKRIIRWLTAYPILPDGKLGLCGNRGKQPSLGGKTEWVSGGAFLAKRSALFQNFNFQLFDLYEKKLGKGEDAITGYTLSKQGLLVNVPDLLFYHNDQKDSTYSIDHYSFSRRVTFSRAYLSMEKTRLEKKSLTFSKIHYHWYTLFRILGLLINFLIDNSENRKKLLRGALDGWKLSFKFTFKFLNDTNLDR
jgi:glycosyltransferase involved in cell wall biosynthesis